MSKLLGNPKLLAILIISVGALLVSVAGGALGNAFNLGFLGHPLAFISLAAEPISSGSIITNSMVATWAAIIVLIMLSYFATRRMNDVPTGLQNIFEIIIEYFLHLAEGISGREKARRFLPLVLTIFLFIVTANWMGILPGYGTIGWVESVEEVKEHAEHMVEGTEEHVDLEELRLHLFSGTGGIVIQGFGSGNDVTNVEAVEQGEIPAGKTAGRLIPYLRSANTDVNTTLAIAMIVMFMVHFWGFAALGLGHAGKFINFRDGPIGLFVGILEAISEVARLISFTFRLFGNIFAGEVLLLAMAFLLPLIGIIPFLGLELFVGVVQAFIFAMLTLVFATMATLSHSSNGHD